jgi:uncharacterized repeat protein (TIGR03803 family)
MAVAHARQIPQAGTGQPNTPAVTNAASIYSYGVLYNFCSVNTKIQCADGTEPTDGLIQDSAGNFYGTTELGGATDFGTVFKLDSTGHYSVLYNFCPAGEPCVDGAEPKAGLIQDGAGNFYGTTESGGANAFNGGAIFELDNTGRYSVLYSFCSAASCADGRTPLAGLVRDAAGNLYGTTEFGGTKGLGTVFELDSTNHYSVLYSFCPSGTCTDGENPKAGLLLDSLGNLYGTASNGGANLFYGAIFKLDTSNHETVLHSFCSTTNSSGACTDGNLPVAGLIQDAAGNLYGTTSAGGANANISSGQGTIFELDHTGHYSVLYSFCSVAACADGSAPTTSVIRDAAGDLYGTTSNGAITGSVGTVYELDITGHETVLHNFCTTGNCTDGENPAGGLFQDAAGNLFGTTVGGGSSGPSSTGGTIFELTAAVLTAQTITFPNPGPLTYGIGSISLIASATSGLSVNFAITSASPANVATVSGDTLTVNNVGTVAVQATQSGNSTYAAATPVTDPITILPAPLAVACGNTSLDYGWPIPTLPVSLTGVVPGDAITATCTTTATEGSPAGPYTIAPKLNDPNSRLSNYIVASTNGTLTIGPQATSVPLILSLSQWSATTGAPSFTLTVTGANFASNAAVLWNGAVRATTDVSSTEVKATILASDLLSEATGLVTVVNPAPNPGTSAAQPFAVQSTLPTITAASLADTADASGDRMLTLTGTDFLSTSSVKWNTTTLTATYVNAWTITAVVTASDYALLPVVVTVANSSVTSLGFEVQ